MTLFQNGHAYSTAIPLPPPAGQRVPTVEVEMAGASGNFRWVIGKIDTGASLTLLTFDTAEILGIDDPTQGFMREGTAVAANSESFPYYTHRVIVSVPNPSGSDLMLVLEAGFADVLPRNLFGVDWLDSVCIAVDKQKVYLLRN